MAHARFCSLLLIKAAPTEWDRHGRLSGSADHPLVKEALLTFSNAGRSFAGSLAAVLTGPEQACAEVAKAFAPRRKAKPLSELHEPSFGLWEGLAETEVEQRFRSSFRDWKYDPASVAIPQGEGFNEAQSRVATALVKPVLKHSSEAKHVAVVLRPMAWCLVRCWLEGRELSDFWAVYESGSVPGGEVAPILVESETLKEFTAAPRTTARTRKA